MRRDEGLMSRLMLLCFAIGCQMCLQALWSVVAPHSVKAHWCEDVQRPSNIEFAICRDAELLRKDMELNRLYSKLGGGKNTSLKNAQRAWMLERDRCTSMECLHVYYDSRLGMLRTLAGESAPRQSRERMPTAEPVPPAQTGASSDELEPLPDIKPF